MTVYSSKPDADGVMFSYPRYVLKAGQVVVEEGQVRTVNQGREFIVQPEFDPGIEEFRTRILARLVLLPRDDPQFRRNRERIVRDGERENNSLEWDLGLPDGEF